MQFGSSKNEQTQEKWRWQIDNFVDDHQTELAALTWSLQQEWNDNKQTILGIDLKPEPHFVACTKEQLEKLNHNTRGFLREVLGLVDGYKPEVEVLNLVIGEGQIKLIHFQPETSPPECSASLGTDVNSLITSLEAKLKKYF